MNIVYLDNSATTCVSQAAAAKIYEMLISNYGNPSSLHKLGIDAYVEMEQARETIANSIKAEKKEIFFTSGGTESNNLAIFGTVSAHQRKGKRIVTTSIEHPSVLEPIKQLEKRGFETVYLKPNEQGTVPIEKFQEVINENTLLVSCMAINNETGAFLPIDKIAAVIKQKKSSAIFHCDAVQQYGKYDINPARLGIDLMSISAHKIFGPKGIGAIYIKNGVRIQSRSFGGGQEKGIRSGTESVPLIAGFGVAVNEIFDNKMDDNFIRELKQKCVQKLSIYEDIIINSPVNGSDYILNISVLGIKSEVMLHYLEEKGIFVSSGSACKKGRDSHVLTAQGVPQKHIHSALRISFCRHNTMEDIERLVQGIAKGREEISRG